MYYKWPDLYVHSGKNNLSWIPYFVENILKKLSFGEMKDASWDVKKAIITSKIIIQQIYQELIGLTQKPNLSIYPCRLECVLR